MNFKKIVLCKKSRKLLHTLQKANMRVFYAKHKSVYPSLTCGKQVIIKPVQRNMLSSRIPGFCKPFFRNRRCLLRTSWTVLSKLMHIISKNSQTIDKYQDICYISSQLSLKSSFSDKWMIKGSVSLSSIWSMIRNFSSSLIPISRGYISFTYFPG